MATEKNDIEFSSLFTPAQVICQTGQTDRDQTLLDMLRLLNGQQGIGDIEEAHEAVLARENDLPTIVAPGMAMPHARLAALDRIVVVVATSKEGIIYDAKEPDNRVKLIVLTLAPKSAPGAYLQAISCVAKACQDPSTAEVVAHLPTPEQVWAFFAKGGVVRRGNPKRI